MSKKDDPCWAFLYFSLEGGGNGTVATVSDKLQCLLPKSHRGRHKTIIEAKEHKPTKTHYVDVFWPRRKLGF
jgi:hypothetical protein